MDGWNLRLRGNGGRRLSSLVLRRTSKDAPDSARATDEHGFPTPAPPKGLPPLVDPKAVEGRTTELMRMAADRLALGEAGSFCSALGWGSFRSARERAPSITPSNAPRSSAVASRRSSFPHCLRSSRRLEVAAAPPRVAAVAANMAAEVVSPCKSDTGDAEHMRGPRPTPDAFPPRADTAPDHLRVAQPEDVSPMSSRWISVDDDLRIPADLFESLLAAAEVAKNRGGHKIVELTGPDGRPYERLVLSRTRKPRPNFGNRKLLAACDAWKGDACPPQQRALH